MYRYGATGIVNLHRVPSRSGPLIFEQPILDGVLTFPRLDFVETWIFIVSRSRVRKQAWRSCFTVGTAEISPSIGDLKASLGGDSFHLLLRPFPACGGGDLFAFADRDATSVGFEPDITIGGIGYLQDMRKWVELDRAGPVAYVKNVLPDHGICMM